MARLRKLRVALAVQRAGAIAGAARGLNLSQPAVTRAVKSLEGEIGETLFHRSTRSLACTEPGLLLLARVARAQDHLQAAEAELATAARSGEVPAQSLTAHAADHEFAALVAVAQYGTISAAARASEVSQPALNRSLRALETRLGLPLFHRTSNGMRPTPSGEVLLRRAKLAFQEIRQGLEEVQMARGATGGQIRIGALPLTRVRLVPLAVDRLLRRYESAEVAIVDGTYESLLRALRHGDIDVLVGTIRRPAAEGIVTEELFEDDVAIVVGAHHPLAGRAGVGLGSCLRYGWALPFKGVPLRTQFEHVLVMAGLPKPERVIETDSVVSVRTLLMNSDRLAILSRHQVHHEVEAGTLKILPILLRDTRRPVGLALRSDYRPTPLVRAMLDELRLVAAEISEDAPRAA